MSELKISLLGEEVLRERARKVTTFGPALQRLIDDMEETMFAAHGVGLAAPQVGKSLRLFLAYLDEDPEADEHTPPNPHLGKLHVVINPEIIRMSDETSEGVEGCLSIPGYVGDVERSKQISIRFQDRDGKTQKLKLRGWLARVFQHEFDHLDGVLFIDRASQIYEVSDGEQEALEDEQAHEETASSEAAD